jgi:hypothetical protein
LEEGRRTSLVAIQLCLMAFMRSRSVFLLDLSWLERDIQSGNLDLVDEEAIFLGHSDTCEGWRQ